MNRKRLLILLAFYLALTSMVGLLRASTSHAIQTESQTFTETGKSVKGRFLQYWTANGGLAQQGYPISEEIQERSDTDGKTYKIQYFERAVFELHPENQPPYDVLLSLLGVLEYGRRYGSGGAPNQRASVDNPFLFSEVGKTVGGKFRQYWETHGRLTQQGYPISEEFQERSDLDGKTYTVQYFERAVFELHPENSGTEYEVLLSQLGKFRHSRLYEGGPPAGTPLPVALPTPAFTVPNEATNWLREHAIPLTTTRPNDDFSDLTPIRQIIGDARIVAFGEASHGGSEFFTMKHRMLRYLVKEMGFTVFAIEDGWAEAERVNDYVLNGNGSPEQAARRLPVIWWRTQEMVDMLRWMRSYNESRGSAPPVVFQGVDMQGQYWPMEYVKEYLRNVDPTAVDRTEARFNCFLNSTEYRELSANARSQCRAELQRVHNDLTANRVGYETASSHEVFERALHAVEIILQNEERLSSVEPGEVRDRYMAENAGWLLEHSGPNAKVFVWAHNAHVGKLKDEDVPDSTYRSMGWRLKEKYGEGVRLIGFDFYKGSFNAREYGTQITKAFTVSSSQPKSYGSYFHSAGIPVFALDLRGITKGSSATDWLIGPRRLWLLGTIYYRSDPNSGTGEVRLTEAFDAVIFIDTISPTTLGIVGP